MPSAIRMLVTDLDGTLLDPNGQITPRTRLALEAIRRRDVAVTLATARRFVGALPVARELGGPLYLVLYDGAQVRDFPAERILLQRTLDREQGQLAAQIIAEAGLRPIAQHADESGERLTVAQHSGHGPWADEYLALNASMAAFVPTEHLVADGPEPLRLVAFGPLRRVRAAAQAVAQRLMLGEAIKTRTAVGTQILPLGSYGAAELTIFAAGVSKGSAMTWLARELDISPDAVLAIGDGVNDVSMLQAAGVGVAMAGAPPVVLRAAGYRTTSNEHDGVALALERFILEASNEPQRDEAGA